VVPKLFASGKSFKTLAAYLLHDADKAATSERVQWTHTHNLASDDPGLAVHEMLWSYRAADDLKRQAGVKAGGRRLENPVRHFSLNWHPSETPSREHMVEKVESFLAHMGWQEHQALIVCHDDKHPHVHVMLNSVHPETGRALDASFEKRRAQAWALAYEREHELIFCEQRLKPAEERTPSATRETWQKLREYEREDDKAEEARYQPDYFERQDANDHAAREWEALKTYQREQREQFFAGGKEAYRDVRNAAYREVRTEMREEWRDYYQAERDGMAREYLAAMKADILARQRQMLDARREEACTRLREQRDEDYRALLEQHREQRAELTGRQNDGLRSYNLFDTLYPAAPRDADREKARHRTAGEQRLHPAGERTPSPTRDTWAKLRAYETEGKTEQQRDDKPLSYFDRHDGPGGNAQEWSALRTCQQEQRTEFFRGGRQAYREARKTAYREVQAELRGEWQKYRHARATGFEKSQLAFMKAALINRQKDMLNQRAQSERRWMRHCRDKELAALREHQKVQRNELRQHQRQNLRSYGLLDGIYPADREARRDQLRSAEALRSATQISTETRLREEATRKEWRERVTPALEPRGSDDHSRERAEAALRSSTESTTKVREREEGIRQAWSRVRTTRGRGRD
jgi:hypothetical protein